MVLAVGVGCWCWLLLFGVAGRTSFFKPSVLAAREATTFRDFFRSPPKKVNIAPFASLYFKYIG
jgi:hypothetical protein